MKGNILKMALVAIIGLAAMLYAADDRAAHGHKTLSMTPNKGVTSIVIDSPVDSFTYVDTIEGEAIEWTSPLYKLLVLPGLQTDTMTLACSLAFNGGSDVLGFEFLKPASLTLSQLVDTLVDSINNVADLSDSVTASNYGDSAVLVTAKFSGETFGGRFTFVPADSLDSASVSPTTAAMAVDSLLALMLANETLDSLLLMADWGDSILLSARFEADSVIVTADSATTANYLTNPMVRRKSFVISLGNMLDCYGFKGGLILSTGNYTWGAAGAVDTFIVAIKTVLPLTADTVLVDSDLFAGLPCTLLSQNLTDDTLNYHDFFAEITCADTAHVDADSTATWLLSWFYKIWGQHPTSP